MKGYNKLLIELNDSLKQSLGELDELKANYTLKAIKELCKKK